MASTLTADEIERAVIDMPRKDALLLVDRLVTLLSGNRDLPVPVADALGLLATKAPTPTDEDIAHLRDRRRIERFG